MSGCDSRPGCPVCGEKEELGGELAFDPMLDDRCEHVVICLNCGWTGREDDLLTDAEAQVEGRLHRLDL